MAKEKVKKLESPKVVKPKKKPSGDGMREFAFILFFQRVAQNEIAERCGVSIQTITAWKKADNWEAKRAAKTISIDELIVKALQRINEMLDDPEFNADGFAKAVSQLKTLKQSNTVDDEIMCFMDFQNFLLERRNALDIDDKFIKRLVAFQDMFIQMRLGNGKN